jgi:hypothetical protein
MVDRASIGGNGGDPGGMAAVDSIAVHAAVAFVAALDCCLFAHVKSYDNFEDTAASADDPPAASACCNLHPSTAKNQFAVNLASLLFVLAEDDIVVVAGYVEDDSCLMYVCFDVALVEHFSHSVRYDTLLHCFSSQSSRRYSSA